MQRIELRNGGEPRPRDSGVAAERRVTLVFPATSAEYEEARVEVGSGAAAPSVGRYVLTTDEQRRAWGLPDLANGAAAPDTAAGEPGAAEGPDPVPVVDAAEALDLLFEDDADRSGDAAAVKKAGDAGGGAAAGAHRRNRTDPVPFVSLKHNRGPIPEDLRAAFSELCRQTRIDGLLKSIDALIEPLERSAAPDLEAARLGIETLRRREVTPERLCDPGGEDPADERAERVAQTCWMIERRLRKLDNALDRLDFSNLKVSPPPSFRHLLRRVEDDPVGNAPSEGILAACDQALRGFERAAGEAVGRIRAVAAARRAVEAGEWTHDALRRIRLVLGRLEAVRAVLDDDGVPNAQLERLRAGLKELEQERQVDRPAGGPDPGCARAVRGGRAAGRGAGPRARRDPPGAAREPGSRRRGARAAAGGGVPAVDRAGARADRHRSGDAGARRGVCRAAGDQGAHPRVPGHTPPDLDDMDR